MAREKGAETSGATLCKETTSGSIDDPEILEFCRIVASIVSRMLNKHSNNAEQEGELEIDNKVRTSTKWKAVQHSTDHPPFCPGQEDGPDRSA